MKYVLMALKQVRKIPIWDNPSHNAARKLCFKSLSSMFKKAFEHEKDKLDYSKRAAYKNRLVFFKI